MVSIRALAVISSSISAAYYFVIHPFIFPTTNKPSQLLLDIVHYLDFVQTLNVETKKMLLDDPFKELVNEVRPTLDEMGSIKAQLTKYEQMDLEKFPDGPQLFIKTTSERVEKVQENVFTHEKKYRLILDKSIKYHRILMEQHLSRFKTDLIRVLETMGNQMQDYKVYFLPEDRNSIQNAGQTVNIDFIKTLLLRLSRYFLKIESLYPDVDVLTLFKSNPDWKRYESGDRDKELVARIEKFSIISDKLIELTQEHGDSTFQGVNPFVVDIYRQVQQRVPEIMEHFGRCKERYEKLVDGVDADVTSSRERIRNLGRGKSKKVDEF